MPTVPRTLFFVAPDWWGSDPRALAQAFRAEGHALIGGNYEEYFPQTWTTSSLRLLRRLIRPRIVREFNRSLLKTLETSSPDFLLVFKGMLVSPALLRAAEARGIPKYCFYPDVTFGNFGEDLVACMPLYDALFTTKRFHLDLEDTAALTLPAKRILVSHGYDPEVHRPLHLSKTQRDTYGCDVAYVGVWTPKKEQALHALCLRLPNLDLHIWGPGWERASSAVRQRWRGRGAFGDEATVIYQAAKINLCVLTEAGHGIARGDEITVRTWQIPASGGFLLHEETDELKRHFSPGEEVGVFKDFEEMAARVTHFLSHPDERERVRNTGHVRCLRDEQTYTPAARAILAYHEEHALSRTAKRPI